ncbi:BlaI/MecI/CopY family transcriptional regulator [Sessilibacter corallicola]|uniref:BlaI/MecI/CopY family transcriptional regulator n=1 Tax=Sessilibacter corallicola TaxID=2904075 RepID=UPI001E5D361D|nr:BlaI/MecI/CopY family transcriptional regulator [Sessilibacter corallicola]MCE2029679.1 BlaI/MecI/CopY family transcriptional regulator [Sessilibacter corallicola]
MQMILGDLEKRVLHYLWATPESDAKQVHKALTMSMGGKLNTIQSTLDRLFKKNLLSRQKVGHAYYYSAAVGREALIAQLIQSVTGDFVNDKEDGLIAAFASVSKELDDEQLTQLEDLIQQQRQKLSKDRNDGNQ